MKHRIEIATDAADYKKKIDQLQLENWTIQMVQFLVNQWVITATADGERPKLEFRKAE